MATASNCGSQQETNSCDHLTSEKVTDRQTTEPDSFDSSRKKKGAEIDDGLEKAWPQEVMLCSEQETGLWPSSGKHILATYDERSITVYQAFCPAIAVAAVKDQRFGGGGFSFTRMSWIKTNFLWMMHRCGWATKRNQERVLAVQITLDGFNQILAEATTSELQKSQGQKELKVRLQWDPDHSPTGEKKKRRAIQLGLKDDILLKYATQWIIRITDVTPFVQDQHQVLQERGNFEVSTPLERVYTPPSSSTRQRIELD